MRAGGLAGLLSSLVLAAFLLAPTLRAQDAAPPGAAIPIYEIQGSGLASSWHGEWLDTYGIVTGVTQNGFYLQDPRGDGDPQTSDGLYVYTHTTPTASVGQCVYVERAYASEFYDKTELSRVEAVTPIDACGMAAIQPVAVSAARLRHAPADSFERFEGMLVAIDGLEGVVHGPTKRFRTGEIEIGFVVESYDRYIPGRRIFAGQPAYTSALMYLSNAVGATLPDVNWGDRLVASPDQSEHGSAGILLAILDYNFGKYQLLPLPGQRIQGENSARTPGQVQAATPSDFTVCTFNLFGLGRGSAQFPADADYLLQLAVRARLIAENLQACTIVGLQEVGSPQVGDDLARLLNAEFGLDYTATVLQGPGGLNAEFPINTGFLTRDHRVRIVRAELRQACSGLDYSVLAPADACPAGQFALFDRPPLLFEVLVDGEWGAPYPLVLINNHWKSKGGDEEINVVRREAQARYVASLVTEIVQAQPDAHVVVLGDLNDFPDSAPVHALQRGVLPNLVSSVELLGSLQRYTYIFNGASQELDYILMTANMMPVLSEVTPVRVDADFASPAQVDAGSVAHASDHDPILVRLRPSGAAWLAGEWLWPEIELALADSSGRSLATALSDQDGAVRVWNLEPGAVSLRYRLPEYVAQPEPVTSLSPVLTPGLNSLPTPNLQHRTVLSATSAVYVLLALDAMDGQIDLHE